eukprot:scaffold43647_cov53-Phaeocystis_antarctica.AAC.2
MVGVHGGGRHGGSSYGRRSRHCESSRSKYSSRSHLLPHSRSASSLTTCSDSPPSPVTAAPAISIACVRVRVRVSGQWSVVSGKG